MLLKIDEPSPTPAARGLPLLRMGFRPFYLGCAAAGVGAMALWMRVLEGSAWSGALPALAWHQHEMLYGLALAAIAGFLLTAGRVWTGLETPHGGSLGFLVGHWLLARVFLYAGPLWLGIALDAGFPLVLAFVMGRLVVKAGNRRNYFAPVLLVALALTNLLFYGEQAGVGLWPAGTALRAALYLVLMMIIVIGGRVVPAFTGSALPLAGVRPVSPWLERLAIIVTVAALAFDLVGDATSGAGAWPGAALATLAALLHGWRQWHWRPFATFARPLLWILHISYAWIPVGLLLLAAWELGWLSRAASVHALGVGAMGGMILGMITRTALGHTGRPLVAGWPETAAYLLVHLAAVARLLAVLLPDGPVNWLSMAGHGWMAAFLLYMVAYVPRLVTSRVDGRPG